jgi:DNA helicase HerA-like ATPase
MGVPCFVSDVKGDLSGFCQKGEDSEDMQKRIEKFGLKEKNWEYKPYPVNFFDIYGKDGATLRVTISEMGPELLSQILGLTDVQKQILSVAFTIADDAGLLLLDTKDLKKFLTFLADNRKEFEKDYGALNTTSLNTVIRAIIALEAEGADQFFGEPAIDLSDFFKTDQSGKGFINILNSSSLINKPRMYCAFMLYLLSELFEFLPEVGDLEKPKFAFFFDEAHLLFSNADKMLLEKIEQVVKLIRSKGVSVFFITQNPSDISNGVLAQLSTKIQHALRAYTPKEQKAIKTIAESFRTDGSINVEEELEALGTGEAIVSTLDEKGVPTFARKVKILPPQSYMKNAADNVKDSIIKQSPLFTKYDRMVDRESAYEILTKRYEQMEQKAKDDAKLGDFGKKFGKTTKSILKSMVGTTGTTLGRAAGSILTDGSSSKLLKTLGKNLGSSAGRNVLGTFAKMFLK